MLFVTTDTRTLTYHISEGPINLSPMEKVLEVQADGDEANYIKDEFDNIPFPVRTRVIRWYGDMAAFIAQNLR